MRGWRDTCKGPFYDIDDAGIERDLLRMEEEVQKREAAVRAAIEKEIRHMSDPVAYDGLIDTFMNEIEDALADNVLDGACELTNEQQESEMSEGYHGFGGSNYGYEERTESIGPAIPKVKEPRAESVDDVRDVRRVLDEIKVYADKLTTDVKIPRATVKDWVKRLETVSK